ncbi:MAG: hypothetical protein CL843_05120 [Crocinitomicaceae bacterium]|nr:hypothetical protein [Crocinitomicaceae bacterium]|tara:strand:- start:290 stop:1117 length:828 start_codon:yes stop_codon:yes gene_type:complete
MRVGKKILVIINENEVSLSALRFVEQLFDDINNYINIIYISDKNLENKALTSDVSPMRVSEVESEQLQAVLEGYLKKGRNGHLAKFTLHKQVGNNNEVFMWKCTYADLMVATQSSYDSLIAGTPDQGALLIKNQNCSPIVVVPDDFEKIDNILIAYNAKKSGVSSIKQFCYLFENFCLSYDVNLLSIFEDGVNPFSMREERLFVDYLKQHCQRLAVHKYIGGEQTDILKSHLDFSDRTLLVTNERLMGDVSKILTSNAAISSVKDISSAQFIAYQ